MLMEINNILSYGNFHSECIFFKTNYICWIFLFVSTTSVKLILKFAIELVIGFEFGQNES